ncbi:hypothetical protein [Mesorhizobium sangaii]|uniref:Lipoprotein n=1 Tax=Mesorhizobium sangaii TaxID=505389 RepID=A0A841P606_9HYPH|nr:hypothetical protein [Mesorhizobium sangaii]MBB6410657.1 hypothetical protein [Mesorhizobium sangaii]
MKTFLVMATALGLSVSAACANCPFHEKVQASVDTQKTASVEKADVSKAADTQTIKKEVPAKTE